MPVQSRLWVVVVAACLLVVPVGVSGCGTSETDQAEVEAAEQKTLEAERELEEVRKERVREEREADEAKEAAQKKKQEEARKAKRREVRAEEDAAAEASDSAPEAAEEASEPPNVVGLPLPAARKAVERAGYEIKPENTDTTFGIYDESNYTVCTQDLPRGSIVVVLAQKYGC